MWSSRRIWRMTDGTSATRAAYQYDPYGRRTKLSGDLDSDRSFTGHLSLPSVPSALFAAHRVYDTETGRWLSEDPAGRVDGEHLYRYARNEPTGNSDPSGLVSTPGCSKGEAKRVATAAGRAEARIANGCCLPESEKPNKQKWINKIRTTNYHCEPIWVIDSPFGKVEDDDMCAVALPPSGGDTGQDVTIYTKLAFNRSRCGCLPGVVLHEVAHLMGFEHPEPGKIAKGCFACALDYHK